MEQTPPEPGTDGSARPVVERGAPAAGPTWRPDVERALGTGAGGFLAPAWLDHPNRWLWQARVGRAPAGCLVAERVLDRVDIHVLWVHPDWRRRGIAAAMVRSACRSAAAEGARIAGLEVRVDNHAGRALYAGLGFRPVGQRPGYYADGADALVLERSLEPRQPPSVAGTGSGSIDTNTETER